MDVFFIYLNSEKSTHPESFSLPGCALYFIPCSVNLRRHAAHLLEAAGKIALAGIAQGVADLPNALCCLA